MIAARTLLVATTNPNKVREIRPLLAGLDLDVLTLRDVPPVPEPDETGQTFWENARIKALAYSHTTGLTVVAEDSGLEIDALEGAPGVQSARFFGADVGYSVRFTEIFRRLATLGDRGPDARFVTALAVVANRRVLFESEAAIEGRIASQPSGEHGFGYDPIFFYPPFGRTTAEMTLEEKSAVSHRARAFRDLACWLRREMARGALAGRAET
jgi:XTP/dITP diphosphohydrolase